MGYKQAESAAVSTCPFVKTSGLSQTICENNLCDGTVLVWEVEGFVAAWLRAHGGRMSWGSGTGHPMLDPHSFLGPFYHLHIPP